LQSWRRNIVLPELRLLALETFYKCSLRNMPAISPVSLETTILKSLIWSSGLGIEAASLWQSDPQNSNLSSKSKRFPFHWYNFKQQSVTQTMTVFSNRNRMWAA
jgi:hypothetical protein